MPRTLAALLAAVFAAPAVADDDVIRAGQETFKLNLGLIVSQSDSSLTLQGPQGRGVAFDLEKDAGVERDHSTLLGSAVWRFAPNHRVGLQWFSTRQRAERVLDRDLVIQDQTIPAGSTLSTTFKTDFLIANYQYSFIRSQHVELAGMAGIYGARFKYTFDSTNPPTSVDAKLTAPLPVFGLSLDTFLDRRWTVSTFIEGLVLKVDDIEGRVVYSGLSVDYMVTRHLGIGAGYSLSVVEADAQKDSFRGGFEWRTNNFFLYAQARF